MKILIINTVPTGKNGITNVIFNYLKSIEKDSICFDYLSINDVNKTYDTILSNFGGEIIVIERSAKNIVSYYSKLKYFIKKNHYDAVHIHGNSHTVVLELLAARFAGCKVRVVHAHNTMCSHMLIHRLFTPVFNLLCTHRLACGDAAGFFMFGNRPFRVINNGINTDDFAYNTNNRITIRNKLGWENSIIIGHVGLFTEVKNQSFIIDVFKTLITINPSSRLILIGDGPNRIQIEKKIESLGLSNCILLTGAIEKVNEYLSAIDYIVMPSLFEGLPLTLIEQQANGLQCLVSENITREVDITGNVLFLSLSCPSELWAKTILETYNKIMREERSRQAIYSIRQAGYCIIEESRKLKLFYESIIQ